MMHGNTDACVPRYHRVFQVVSIEKWGSHAWLKENR